MNKKLLALAVLAVAVLAGVYLYRTSRPVTEVFLTTRGTATYAVYGTVKVVPTVSFAVHACNAGVLKFSDELAKASHLIGLEIQSNQFLGEIVNESLDRDYAKAEAEWLAAEARQKLGPASLPALKTQENLVARMQKLAALSNA